MLCQWAIRPDQIRWHAGVIRSENPKFCRGGCQNCNIFSMYNVFSPLQLRFRISVDSSMSVNSVRPKIFCVAQKQSIGAFSHCHRSNIDTQKISQICKPKTLPMKIRYTEILFTYKHQCSVIKLSGQTQVIDMMTSWYHQVWESQF